MQFGSTKAWFNGCYHKRTNFYTMTRRQAVSESIQPTPNSSKVSSLLILWLETAKNISLNARVTSVYSNRSPFIPTSSTCLPAANTILDVVHRFLLHPGLSSEGILCSIHCHWHSHPARSCNAIQASNESHYLTLTTLMFTLLVKAKTLRCSFWLELKAKESEGLAFYIE